MAGVWLSNHTAYQSSALVILQQPKASSVLLILVHVVFLSTVKRMMSDFTISE